MSSVHGVCGTTAPYQTTGSTDCRRRTDITLARPAVVNVEGVERPSFKVGDRVTFRGVVGVTPDINGEA